ncbi:MAG: methyltransferase domain-containing protein, partial [Desulfohalobiaceae bacterium]
LFPDVLQKLGYEDRIRLESSPAGSSSRAKHKEGADVSDLRGRIVKEAEWFKTKGKKSKKSPPDAFRPKRLSGLLVLTGQDFVRRVFEVVLDRAPEKKEQEHYLQALGQGRMNRIDVLGRLRRSQEGRKKKVRLQGLYCLYGLQALARRTGKRLPLAAGLLRRLAALGTALVRAPALEQAEFMQDQIRRRLESRIKNLEEKHQNTEKEQLKFQQWCKQRLQSLERDWVVNLLARREQGADQGQLTQNVQQEHQDAVPAQAKHQPGLPWSVYAGFEDLFRGTRQEVMQGLQVLAPLACNPELPGPGEGFAHQVLDLGCGRGEWLQVLQERGVSALGLELNPEFVSRCRVQGLEAVQAEALDYMGSLPENSVPVISALHLIEHLAPEYRYILLQECFRVLVPGGLALLETPNPRNILVGSGDFYRDPEHVTPIFPDTLAFLGQMFGFEDSTAFFFNPERTAFYSAAGKRFDALQDYVQVSRDFFWTGRKPA